MLILVWACTILRLIWFRLPFAMGFFSFRWMTARFIGAEDAPGPEVKGNTGVWNDEILDLGFSYLGLREEGLIPWGRKIRELVYFDDQSAAFAALPMARGYGYYFISPLSDGSLVMTTRSTTVWISANDHATLPIGKVLPDKAFDIHQDNVESRAKDGVFPIGDFTRESRLAATRAYYASAYAHKQMRRIGGISLLSIVIYMGFLAYACKAFLSVFSLH
ncbi:MAG: hypothetical protein ABI876_06410 [Bacteroidota bacterium]